MPPSTGSPDTGATRARPVVWLVAGIVVGVAAAAFGLLRTDTRFASSLPARTVASVNGTLIFEDQYQRLLDGLEADLREPVSDTLRQRVLDRMIDEELLVQRGLELGLAESDRRVRADITQAMIRSIVVEAEDRPPDETTLRGFYDEEQGFFTQPGRLRVAQLFFRVPSAAQEDEIRARATDAAARWRAGEDESALRERLADEEVSRVPDTLLPPAKLREYIGPTALRSALELEVGAVGEPVRSGTGIHVLRVVDREAPRVPPFEELREQVQAEWVRRAGDRALRSYLDDLRARAEVVVRTPAE